jgi:uncharacterized protein YdeI (YjbR/CyaY-like superfamily)
MKPIFFRSPLEFRAWLERHHEVEQELWVGFYKRGAGKPSLTWPESVDEALCFGWIDGVRRSLDGDRYTIRFTPRKARSKWSAVNVKRATELTRLGRMSPAGRAAFARWPGTRAGYSYEERESATLGEDHEQRFRRNAKAWAFFQSQPPGYRRTATWWVVSAKREETRLKRLATLIDDSAHGRTIGPLTRPARAR